MIVATNLGELFESMISSTERAIKPTPELARLTLETNQLESARRSSTLQSQRRPTLGMADSQGHTESSSAIHEDDAKSEHEHTEESKDAISTTGETALSPDHNPLSTSRDANAIANQDDIKTEASADRLKSLTQKPASSNQESESLSISSEIQSLDSVLSLVNPIEAAMQETPEDSQHPPMIYSPPEGKPPPIPPRPTKLTTIEEFARQQDVTEVLANAVFQLSCAIRGTGKDSTGEQRDEIHDTLYGEEIFHVLHGTASPQSAVQFLFLNLPIWNDPKDVYAAIDNDFDVEERGSSEVYKTITKLPPVLCMLFGRVTGSAANQQKINSHIDVPSTLYMDRYLDAPEGSSLVQRRAQAWLWKKDLRRHRQRLKTLEPENKPTMDSQLDDAIDALHQVGEVGKMEELGNTISETAIMEKLIQLSQKVKQERNELHAQVEQLERQVNDSFTDSAFRQHEYKLHAAFFHRGSSGSGHYWVYIYDHVQELWRKYNDDYVTHVSNLKEIFGNARNDTTNPNYSSINPANAYFLVYVRSNKTTPDSNIVETVTRQPVEMQQQEHAVAEYHSLDSPTQGEASLRPIGSDPVDAEAVVNQMSHLPPGNTSTGGWEPEWDENALREAVEKSLKTGGDDGWTEDIKQGNQSVPSTRW